MFRKKITIGKKIAGGFGIVLIILIAVVGLSYQGAGNILNDAQQVIYGNRLMGLLVQKEIDHLNWTASVNALLTDETVASLDVETDHKKCELGSWLNSENRAEAERLVPSLGALLKTLEKPHQQLHLSVAEIQTVYRQADVKLPVKLVKFEVELLKWIAQIQDILTKKQTSLTVVTDPAQSELGQWLRKGKEAAIYKSAGSELKKTWDQLIAQHSELFETATYLQDNLAGFEMLDKATATKEKVTAEWSEINTALFDMLETVKKEIIVPSQTSAMESGFMSDIADWMDIERGIELYFKQALLQASLAVAKVAGEESLMLPQVLEEHRERINSGLIKWKSLIKGIARLEAATADFEEQTGKWIVGGLRYVQAMMDEANAQSMIDDNIYTFEEEILPKLNETLKSLATLQNHADEALMGIKEANAIYTNATMPSLESVRLILNQIKNEVKQHIINDNVLFNSVQKVRRDVSLAGFFGLVVGIATAILMTIGIIKVLRRFSGEIDEGAGQVTNASAQVASASQILAEGASQQASSLEETSASIEDIVTKTRQSADHSNDANQVMQTTKTIVREANDSMDQLEASMAQISGASDEMSKIIKTIDEIAFQTNLLAPNAAVEAARAGEVGAGFAVVAEEVRNLALRSAEAAADTSELIINTTKRISDGAVLMKKTNLDFDKVEESVLQVSKLINAISQASNEQTQGLNQIKGAVSDMDAVTQHNAASAEESASASEELYAQAEQLKESVIHLKKMVDGNESERQSVDGSDPVRKWSPALHQTNNGETDMVSL